MKTIEEKNRVIMIAMQGYDFEHTEGGIPVGDFSNSWEWLMPVVHRCLKYCHENMLNEWEEDFIDAFMSMSIDKMHDRVYNFIEFYNKN